MPNIFEYKSLNEINIQDPFFDSLKKDYPGTDNSTGFINWFQKKSDNGEKALTYFDGENLKAFIFVKHENEELELKDKLLPKKNRYKISTIKIDDTVKGRRLGEGALGLLLWDWSKSTEEIIYVTVFQEHTSLISLLERFGFENIGVNPNNELVYARSKNKIDYSDPYKSFPFIDPNFQFSGYLPINDNYHDELFPYSELKNEEPKELYKDVSNGLTKFYIGNQIFPDERIGKPLLVYRIFTGNGQKTFKSCVTSWIVVNDSIKVKENGKYILSLEKVLSIIGNKSIFNKNKIEEIYNSNAPNIGLLEFVYYGFLGEGNNINHFWLKNNGYWGNCYPTQHQLKPREFLEILEEGNINVDNIIID